MGSYKKIGLSHEMGLIDTPPLSGVCVCFLLFLSPILSLSLFNNNAPKFIGRDVLRERERERERKSVRCQKL